MSKTTTVHTEVTPLLWSADVGSLLTWATTTLGLVESWRATSEEGQVEHAELLWAPGHYGKANPSELGTRISISWSRGHYADMGPSGISLRVDDPEQIDRLHAQALERNAKIIQGAEQSRVAYSFTVLDPDGNQWWVNAESGFLDELRGTAPAQ